MITRSEERTYPLICWFYPSIEKKVAPRDLGCSDCGNTIKRGNIYYRMHHGRYCPNCAAKYRKDGK